MSANGRWGNKIMDKRYLPPLWISTVVTAAMIFIGWRKNAPAVLALATPFSLIVYVLYFSVGSHGFIQHVWQWCGKSLARYLALPLALAMLQYLYVAFSGNNPLQANSWQIPLLFCAPVVFYRLVTGDEATITWKDAIGVMLCVLPYVMHDYPFSSDLPLNGGGIESLYLTLAMVAAVYAVAGARRMPHVGFFLYYTTDALKKSMSAWALFFVIVLVVGIPGGLVKWVGHQPVTASMLISGFALFLRTLFGTALPEELFFRGAFMNLLQQRIRQTGNWQRYMNGSLLLFPLAATAGYTTHDKAQWFPLVCAMLLWGGTKILNRRQPQQASIYTSLLIVSTLFGLAHYHIHSTIFMGLAIIAGWTYGHVYQKTGSVFYSALTHTMVNISPALFGFVLTK